MKHLSIKIFYRFAMLLLPLALSGCDYDDEDVMNPSSWASIFVVAAVLLFFYYLYKFFIKREK